MFKPGRFDFAIVLRVDEPSKASHEKDFQERGESDLGPVILVLIFNEFQQLFSRGRRCDLARLKRTFARQLVN